MAFKATDIVARYVFVTYVVAAAVVLAVLICGVNFYRAMLCNLHPTY